MAFIDIILQKPSYGWANERGDLVVPKTTQMLKEAFSRINIFKTKKNWISFSSAMLILIMLPFLVTYLVYYFSWSLTFLLLLYSMFCMSLHTTVWLHRYCTHRAFQFSHPAWRFLVQNLVIKTVPEEIYVISHHVHHVKSDQPGDPYNARGGLLYCMLAETNHQCISKELSETDYNIAVRLVRHTGIWINTYDQYCKWGSIASPFYTVMLWILNWSFWSVIFYFIGGPGMVCAMFSAAMFWFITVRTFNYTGHGKGNENHKEGIDFDRDNLSINQVRPGILAGEWHNNHHLYPASARTGFLPYQLDLAWGIIYLMYQLGIVSKYHDSKQDFINKYKSSHRQPVTRVGEEQSLLNSIN